MPNKTLYVREGDLPLWEVAQSELGESISALFGKFLREKLAMIDAVVHVVHSTAPSQEGDPGFAVMFAPLGSDGPMKPHYVTGWEHLGEFLTDIGFSDEAARGVESDLRREASVSVRMNLARPGGSTNTNVYRLRFTPVRVDAGKQSWTKVNVTGEPLSPETKRWSATFHDLEKCLTVISQCMNAPPAQLAAIRRSLLEGQVVELGGSGGAVQFVVRRDQLMQMGLVPVE
jgi:hypothetical protein